jgi:DNA-binding MarR family transcriptional regulator
MLGKYVYTRYSPLASLHGEPLTMSALADRLAMDRTTLTRNLKPLVAAGLVEITPGQDARNRIVSMPTAGARRGRVRACSGAARRTK